MEERFAAENCYGENEHFDALSSNTKARSLPSSKIAKVEVNRISRCARRCSAITKIDRDRRQLESHRSFIVSPVVNAQMLPISTHEGTTHNEVTLSILLLYIYKAQIVLFAKRPKVF